MPPVHPEDYDLFEDLDRWEDGGRDHKTARQRSWAVRSLGFKTPRPVYACVLDYYLSGQVAHIQMVAASPREAAWMAIHEFQRLHGA